MNIIKNQDLSLYSAFKIGGIAKNFYLPNNENELINLMKNLNTYYMISSGSNILINDKKIFENVIFLGDFNNKITRLGDGKYEVGASVKLHKLIKFINMDGYGGIEDLITVPGLVGGSIAMNAGTGIKDGRFIGNYVDKVKCLYKNEIIYLDKAKCNFEYRNSIFKNNQEYIILSVEFNFLKLTKEKIENVVKEKIEHVKYKQDQKLPSLGSVFCEYSYKIMGVIKFIYKPFHKKGVNFTKKENRIWLVNNGRGTYKQVIRIINTTVFFHKLLRKKIRVEVVIWS